LRPGQAQHSLEDVHEFRDGKGEQLIGERLLA
jgi:hypothetical protein